MADFIKELVKKDRFPIFFITYFAFYLNDCIIEPFIVNSLKFEKLLFPVFIRLYCKSKTV